eukprot:9096231-Pyramimonas_sp.AAC.1
MQSYIRGCMRSPCRPMGGTRMTYSLKSHDQCTKERKLFIEQQYRHISKQYEDGGADELPSLFQTRNIAPRQCLPGMPRLQRTTPTLHNEQDRSPNLHGDI